MVSRILVLSAMLLAAAAVIARAARPEVVPIREDLSGLPMELGPWRGRPAADMDERVKAVLGVDDYLTRLYVGPGQSVASLYIGYYQSQREGDTMHSPLNCLPGAGWNPVIKERIPIPVEGHAPVEVNRITIMKGMDRQLVLYWYQSHGRVIASEYWGKIYTVIDALRTNRTDAALVRVICPIAGLDAQAEDAAEQQAVDFVKAVFPSLERFLPL